MSDVAKTILMQLGGNRFAFMTGARKFWADEHTLQFRLPARFARNGINCVRVTLEASDTYTVTFLKIGRAPKFTRTTLEEHIDVYAEDLRQIFESATGLYTSLGTMCRTA